MCPDRSTASASTRLRDAFGALLCHALGDHGGHGDYDQLAVTYSDRRGYDVVIRLDGGYVDASDADDARGRWQRKLDTVLAELDRERAAP